MDFRIRYNETKQIVETNLLQYIEDIKNSRQNTLYQAMEYSLTAGGKRFRPVLHLEVIKLFGGNILQFLDTACALEYIHTYSLIHDDLPAMDNDDYRRGKLTNHKVYGEDIAILAGDALLNSAFEILWEKVKSKNMFSVVKGAQIIARNAGVNGMIAGQVLDIQSEGKDVDLDTLLYIHNKKTGALIEASILSAAFMMEASEQQVDALRQYATHLGLAFQISDDILDVTGTFEDLGKPIGSDDENQKSTFISHYGVEKSKELLCLHVEKAIASLNIFDEAEFLIELAKYVASRNN